MDTTAAALLPPRAINVELPAKCGFLLKLHRYKVLYGGRGSGKCLALGTRVIMADGSLRAVEDVRAGEAVMGPDSKPRRVLSTTRGVGPLYRVKQTSGMDYVVNDAHILSVKKSGAAEKDVRMMPTGSPRNPGGRYPDWPKITNINVERYAAQSERWRAHFRGYRAGCLHFPVRKVLIDPYFLGVWLGDGSKAAMRVTSADAEIRDYCEQIAVSHGGRLNIRQKPGTPAQELFIIAKEGRCNPIWQGFKAYGLPFNKHIPQDYLSNHEEIRLQLLAGLIDTDGTMARNGFAITLANERLARDVKFLADGLGFRTSISEKATICTNNGVRGRAWRVAINGDTWRVPCLLPRKRVRQEEVRKNKDFLLSMLTIEPVGVGEYAGFELDGDHLFCLEDGTVTHNSHSFARALLTLGAAQRLRILCAREIQRSIADSVHTLLKDCIEQLGLQGFYTVTETEIVGANGTRFFYSGLAQHTVNTIKSFEGIDIVWVEEGQTVSERSWKILIPTIRVANSEIWVTFNPDLESDATYQRFVKNTPPGAVVVQMNYYDNPWFPEVLEKERAYCETHQPDDYPNIWLGQCRHTVVGAIYAKEVSEMRRDGRYRAVPYDPRYPVHTVWDLGWNDAMSIIMVQKPIPTIANIVNYWEDRFRTYAEAVDQLDRLGYRWGEDWLPHDGANANPQTGKSTLQILRGLGRKKVKIIGRGDVEDGIRKARMMFPRVYLDDSVRQPFADTGYLGGARLMECLGRYRRNVPKTTDEPATPVHDQFSHAADAFRGLSLIVDKIANDVAPSAPRLPGHRASDPGLGMLG